MQLFRVVSFVLNLNGQVDDAQDLRNMYAADTLPEFHEIFEVQETDIGEWHDDHELNTRMTIEKAVKYFPLEYGHVDYEDYYLRKEYDRVKKIMLKGIKDLSRANQQISDLKEQLAKYQKFDKIIKDIKSADL